MTGTTSTSISFRFSSTVYNQNVAWTYRVEKYLPGTGWTPLKTLRANKLNVSTTWTDPSASGCFKYRVFATNPRGDSLPGKVNNSNCVNVG